MLGVFEVWISGCEPIASARRAGFGPVACGGSGGGFGAGAGGGGGGAEITFGLSASRTDGGRRGGSTSGRDGCRERCGSISIASGDEPMPAFWRKLSFAAITR